MSKNDNKISDFEFTVRNIDCLKKEPDLEIPQSELIEKDKIEELAKRLPFEGQFRQGWCEDDWTYAGYDICHLRPNYIANAYPYHIEIGGDSGNYRLYLRLNFDIRNVPNVKICERRFNSKRKARRWVVQKIFDFEKTSIVKNTIWYLIFKERMAVVKEEIEKDKKTYTWVFSIFGVRPWQVMTKYKKGNDIFGGEKLIEYGTYYIFQNNSWSLYKLDGISTSSCGIKNEEVPAGAIFAIHGFDQKLDEQTGILKSIDEKRKLVFIQTNRSSNDVFHQVVSDILQKIR